MDTINSISTGPLTQKKVWKWYLVLSIIYSSITILTGIIFLVPGLVLPILALWGPVVLAWFVFEIVMFILIINKKIEKVGLWLPSLSIFDFIFSIVLGVIVGATSGPAGLQNPVVGILSVIFPIIILGIAIKLILRK